MTYNKNTQIDLVELTLTKGSKKLDIAQLMDQFILYEDLFQTFITARLIFRDQVNLVGELPIVGGEKIKIRYRTPIHKEIVSLEFVVYKVGERGISNTSENIQMNQLYLCTQEAWWESNNDICGAFQGTYTDIIRKLIQETGSKKTSDLEETMGIVQYVAPTVHSVSKAIKFCSSRANSKTLSPMFFWETPYGYHLKSLKELYRASHDKFLYVEDRSVMGADQDANKVFNTVFNYEIPESNNRLEQYASNAFGADNFFVDHTNARIVKQRNSYDELYHKYDIKLNKFPLNDDNRSVRNNIGYFHYRNDLSHLGAYNRNASLAFMDNYKLLCSIPGDSKLKAGDVLWMEIPSKVGLEIGTEKLISGKWLLRSMKHLITKTTYTMTCELTKDSFDMDVNNKGS